MSYSLRKLDFFSWIFLGLITLIIYRPFLFHVNIGSGDGYLYHTIIADVLEQYKHHIFPVYVGQSLFQFAGAPLGRGPYLLLLVGLINLFTFGQLSSLDIQHAIIILSALGGTYAMFFTLRKLAPKLQWFAFVFAILYITSPIVMGLIAKQDMYFSFITIPYLPFLFYALIRNYKKNDVLSYVLFASSLSIIWMAHPSIAFWCSVVCALFFSLRLLSEPRMIGGLVFAALLFISLNLWHFTTVFSLRLSSYIGPSNLTSTQFAKELINFYKSSFLDAFTPGTSTFYQPGYSLWVAFLFGSIIALKNRSTLIIYLIACVSFLLVLLFPFPFISEFLWAHIPMSVVGLSSNDPMARLYPIIAVLCCFIGVLALTENYPNRNKRLNVMISLGLLLALSWNFYQSNLFTQWIYASSADNASWLLPENVRHRLEYASNYGYKRLAEGIYEPALFNRLLNADGKEVPNYNNNKAMAQSCLSNSTTTMKNIISDLKISFPAQFHFQKTDIATDLMKLKINPNKKYMLCFDMIASDIDVGVFQIQGFHHETLSVINPHPLLKEVMMIPVFTTENMTKDLDLQMITYNNHNGFINLKAFNIKVYDPLELPIKLQSLVPYHATLTNPLPFAYLETAREFIDGYEAVVNGKKEKVMISPTGRVMIPLFPANNDVLLLYKGTLPIRVTFYISLFFWVMIVGYFCNRIFLRPQKQEV